MRPQPQHQGARREPLPCSEANGPWWPAGCRRFAGEIADIHVSYRRQTRCRHPENRVHRRERETLMALDNADGRQHKNQVADGHPEQANETAAELAGGLGRLVHNVLRYRKSDQPDGGPTTRKKEKTCDATTASHPCQVCRYSTPASGMESMREANSRGGIRLAPIPFNWW